MDDKGFIHMLTDEQYKDKFERLTKVPPRYEQAARAVHAQGKPLQESESAQARAWANATLSRLEQQKRAKNRARNKAARGARRVNR